MMNRAMSDAIRSCQPPVGDCVFCAIGDLPVKMKRQWIHHVPETGHIIVCETKRLKPRS